MYMLPYECNLTRFFFQIILSLTNEIGFGNGSYVIKLATKFEHSLNDPIIFEIRSEVGLIVVQTNF